MVAVFLTDAFDSTGPEELEFNVNELRSHGVEVYQAGIDGVNSKDGMEAMTDARSKKRHLYKMYDDRRSRATELDELAKAICTFRKRKIIEIVDEDK